MKRVTLLIALLGFVGLIKADETAVTTWSNKDWSSNAKTFNDWSQKETLLTRNNTAISIGDVITVTFTKTTNDYNAEVEGSGSAATVVLCSNYAGIVQTDFDKQSSPTSASFTISARERDAFCHYGLQLTGDNITVTAVTKTSSVYSGGANSVWVGSSNGWENIPKAAISDIKAGDKIVVNLSKTGSGTDFTLGYSDASWNPVPFTEGTDYTLSESKATLIVTSALETTIRNSTALYVNGQDYTFTSIDLVVEDRTDEVEYAPTDGLIFNTDSHYEIPTEYLKGRKAGDKMVFTVSSISEGTSDLSLKENDWTWIGWVSSGISSTGDLEVDITEGMLTAGKILPLRLSGSNCTVSKITFKPTTVKVSISSAKYATYSCEQKLDFTGKEVGAYYVSSVTSGVATLTRINKVPANTGLILYCETSGTYSIPITTEQTDEMGDNYLVANVLPSTIAASTEGSYHYIFAWDKTNLSSVGFYYLEADHTLAANKAYLETTENYTPQQAQEGAPMLRLDFGEENNTTSVEAIEQTAPCKKWLENGQLYILRDGVTYDIMGRIIK